MLFSAVLAMLFDATLLSHLHVLFSIFKGGFWTFWTALLGLPAAGRGTRYRHHGQTIRYAIISYVVFCYHYTAQGEHRTA
jgi:hypothetical protein